MGTGTDGPGWTDTGTITCRDQGTDPVAEALESYMRAKRNLQAGGFVAPDVFMGLKFSENGHTAATGSNEVFYFDQIHGEVFKYVLDVGGGFV